MLLHDVPYLIHLAAGVKITGRIIRIADEDGLRPVRDEFLEFLDRRKGETGLDRRRNRLDNRTCRNSKSHIIGISRFRNNDLVTRVQTSKKCEKNSLRTA